MKGDGHSLESVGAMTRLQWQGPTSCLFTRLNDDNNENKNNSSSLIQLNKSVKLISTSVSENTLKYKFKIDVVEDKYK